MDNGTTAYEMEKKKVAETKSRHYVSKM